MTDPFSHEDRMQAGQAVMQAFEAIEDPELQQHMITARDALEAASTLMRERHGFDSRLVALSLMGLAFHPILPNDE